MPRLPGQVVLMRARSWHAVNFNEGLDSANGWCNLAPRLLFMLKPVRFLWQLK